MPDRFAHSTIQCLAAVAQHHQLPINPERLIEDYALGAEEPPPATLLRIAGDIGLKASHERMGWAGLLAQQGVFPLIARLALHASELGLTHPVTREPFTLTAPLPHEFEVALKYLRKFGAGPARSRP